MRYFRVVIALFLFYTAYERGEWFFAAFGVFFMLQAIFNMGCGPQGCNVPTKKNDV